MMNQRGASTLDFLFAFTVAFGMFIVVFAMTFTLTVVEITQYVVFASSRAQSAAHYDMGAQEKAARQKYQSLISSDELAPIFQNGWFKVSSSQELEVRQGQGRNFDSDYPGGGLNNREIMHGVRTTLEVPLLQLQFPIIGRVSPDDGGFSTRVAAILLREPTQTECQKFMADRLEALWSSVEGGRFKKFRSAAAVSVPWEDNGC